MTWLTYAVALSLIAAVLVDWRLERRSAPWVWFSYVALAPRLPSRATRQVGRQMARWGLVCVAVALVGLAVSASSEASPERHIVWIALDVSLSMCATDYAPSRLAAGTQLAQHAAQSALRQGASVGLIGFHGQAYVIAPPSRQFVMPSSLRVGNGTAIGEALALVEAQTEGDTQSGEVITLVISDGENNTGRDPAPIIRRLLQRGVRVVWLMMHSDARVTKTTPVGCSEEQLAELKQRFRVPSHLLIMPDSGGNAAAAWESPNFIYIKAHPWAVAEAMRQLTLAVSATRHVSRASATQGVWMAVLVMGCWLGLIGAWWHATRESAIPSAV